MATISWGKYKLEYAESENGAPKEGTGGTVTWTELDTPKDGTGTLTATAGDKVEAKEEGGGVVDVKYNKNTYQFEFQLFAKKGGTRPFTDVDGLIAGEWALRLTPEDDACTGFQIDRCVLHVEDSFTSADGILLKYVAECLKPATGNTVKPYVKGS